MRLLDKHVLVGIHRTSMMLRGISNSRTKTTRIVRGIWPLELSRLTVSNSDVYSVLESQIPRGTRNSTLCSVFESHTHIARKQGGVWLRNHANDCYRRGPNESVDELLDLHFSNFRKRRTQTPLGSMDEIAIMSAPKGWGKTTFARDYLGYVVRDWQMNGIPRLFQFGCAEELSHARTLIVSLTPGILADYSNLYERFRGELLRAVRDQWRIPISGDFSGNPIQRTLKWIASQSPAFIVLDDLDQAFDPSGELSMDEKLRLFQEFISYVGRPLIHTRGIYTLLAGEGQILGHESLTREYADKNQMIYRRIPIMARHDNSR